MAFLRNYGSWYSDGNHGGCAYWNLLVHFVTYDSIRERTAGAEWCLLKTFRWVCHTIYQLDLLLPLTSKQWRGW